MLLARRAFESNHRNSDNSNSSSNNNRTTTHTPAIAGTSKNDGNAVDGTSDFDKKYYGRMWEFSNQFW